jgi:hypothetical protein
LVGLTPDKQHGQSRDKRNLGLGIKPEVVFREGQSQKENMKRHTLEMAIISALGAILPITGSANLVINGDFEAGNTGFTSGYTYAAPTQSSPISHNSNPMWDEGTYTVYNSISAVHSAWTFGPAGDHTSGTGNMLIVNGDTTANVPVWSGTLSAPLTAGTTYEFSAWIASIYNVAPAQLTFSVGGVQIGTTITPASTGVWQQFSATFVATGAPGLGVINLNTVANGNDFVLDDISMVAVPEPATMIAGALLLLPFGASTLRILRKKVAA